MTTEEINELLLNFSEREQTELKKGFTLWHDMKVFKEIPRGGKVDNDTLKLLISNVIVNTWIHAKKFYNKK